MKEPEINQAEYTATYSAEDNTLRIYPETWQRLDDETYALFKDAGFRPAYKQECYFNKRWTPAREDFCLKMAGSIQPDEITMAERAEQRAARFDGYRLNRVRDANQYQRSAEHYSERFAGGQPILAGHHSQRSAEVAKRRMERAQDNALSQIDTANYWAWRAEGVEAHAEYKNNPRTRRNRIKTLLKELRDHQRYVNHSQHMLKLWQQFAQMDDAEAQARKVEYWSGGYSSTGAVSYRGAYDDFKKGVEPKSIIEKTVTMFDRILNGNHNRRWMNHILNRLGYETALLGETPRFEGELTPVILQAFARTHGADKPKATKNGDSFTLTSAVDLPAHIATGREETHSAAEWCDLMQSCGYVVEIKTPRKTKRSTTPLLNIDTAKHLTDHSWNGSTHTYEVIKMTKAEYKRYSQRDNAQIRIASGGAYKFRSVFKSNNGGGFSGDWFAVFLTDSKAHPAPAPAEAA